VQMDRGKIRGYGKAVDMWGVGLMAYIMLFGTNPFKRESQMKTHNAILSLDWSFPKHTDVSAEAKSFISNLLTKSPEQRMTASKALAHAWLSDDVHERLCDEPLSTGDHHSFVKKKLWHFNAERLLSKNIKSSHRTLDVKAIQSLRDSGRQSPVTDRPASPATLTKSTPTENAPHPARVRHRRMSEPSLNIPDELQAIPPPRGGVDRSPQMHEGDKKKSMMPNWLKRSPKVSSAKVTFGVSDKVAPASGWSSRQ